MKGLGAMFVVLLAAGVASAQQPSHPGQQPDSGTQQPTSGEKSKATQEFKAQVVSTDTQAKTITVRKTDTGTGGASKEMTLPVDSKAEPSLKKVNTGDQVKLVCRTDSTGSQIVDKIERVDTRPASDLPPTP